jgi:hypothetical protein
LHITRCPDHNELPTLARKTIKGKQMLQVTCSRIPRCKETPWLYSGKDAVAHWKMTALLSEP